MPGLLTENYRCKQCYRKARTQRDEMCLWLTYSAYSTYSAYYNPAEKKKKKSINHTAIITINYRTLRIEVFYYYFRKLCLKFWKRNWTKKYLKKKMGQLQSMSLHCRKFILLVMENLSGKVKYYIWCVWIFRFYLKCSIVAVTLKHLCHSDGYVAHWVRDASFLGYDTLPLDE